MQPNAQNEPTRRAPTPPPVGGATPPKAKPFAFLQPAVEPDEIGRLGNYRVLRPLGEGGMAFLFLAEDLSLRRPVALKVMKPNLEATAEAWQRFLREARLTASVRHEHLVTVFNAGQEGSACYFAMELLQGESLETRMRRSPGPTVRDIARIGREIATGLTVIHHSGLIHRDIKPSNIWLEAPDGRVKILDLGLARPLHSETNLTQTGLVVGTPAFMSPEQARGEPLDPRTDLFSLGCVLYSLCTGLHPFDGETTMAVLTALAVDNPRPPHEQNPAIPASLSQLVMDLLAKKANERPSSAEEVAEQLGEIEADLPDDADEPIASRVAECDADTDNRRKKLGSGTEVISKRSKKSKRRKRHAAGVKVWLPILALTVLLTAALTFAAVKVVGGWGGPPPDRPGPGPEPGPGPATVINANNVYLTELKLVDNHRFGPAGDRPPPHAPQLADIEPSFGGKRLKHGLFMHPGPSGLPARMTYSLGGGFSRFRTDVCLNDDVRDVPPPMTFRVYGDDKLLWESKKPVTSQKDKQACDIPVKGVDRLVLEVSSSGEPRGAHALWIDPRLEK